MERDVSFPPNPVTSGLQTIQLLVKSFESKSQKKSFNFSRSCHARLNELLQWSQIKTEHI